MAEAHVPIEDMVVFRLFVGVADKVWRDVVKWQQFARDTVGKQLVRAVDSVGANLVEGDGRHGQPDALRFFVIARASAREARYWMTRAKVREILAEPRAEEYIERLRRATQTLNGLIRYRRTKAPATSVRELRRAYVVDERDPFVAWDNLDD